jgi:hypothetical protein
MRLSTTPTPLHPYTHIPLHPQALFLTTHEIAFHLKRISFKLAERLFDM